MGILVQRIIRFIYTTKTDRYGFAILVVYVESTEPISDRLIKIVLNSIQLYMPTTDHSEKKIETEYDKIRKVIWNIPQKDIFNITGNFKDTIEITLSDDQIRNDRGKYGLGDRNHCGERLINFCTDNGITIANKVLKH